MDDEGKKVATKECFNCGAPLGKGKFRCEYCGYSYGYEKKEIKNKNSSDVLDEVRIVKEPGPLKRFWDWFIPGGGFGIIFVLLLVALIVHGITLLSEDTKAMHEFEKKTEEICKENIKKQGCNKYILEVHAYNWNGKYSNNYITYVAYGCGKEMRCKYICDSPDNCIVVEE